MTSEAAPSTEESAAPVASRLAEKRRLLEGLRVPHPVVSTWGLANLEISVPIGSFPVGGADETFVDGPIDAVVGGVAADVSRALGRLGVTVHTHLVVGTDNLGAQVRSQLDGWEGVEATAIPTPECPLRAIAARFDIPIAVMGMGSGTQGFLDAAELGRLESDAGMQPAVGRSSAQPGTLRPTK